MSAITFFCLFMLFLCVISMGKEVVEQFVSGTRLTGRAKLILVLFITTMVLCCACMFVELATSIAECLKAWGLL